MLIAAMMMSIGLVGCMDITESSPKIKEDMKEHLDSKYGRTFEILRLMRGTDFFADNRYDEGLAAPTDDSSEHFTVLRYSDSSGTHFADGFAYVLAQKAASPRAAPLVRERFGDDAVWSLDFTSGNQVSEYAPHGDFSLDDFFEQGEGGGDVMRLNIALRADARRSAKDEERALAELIRSMWENGIRPSVLRLDLYHLGDEDFAQVSQTRDLSTAQVAAQSYYAVWIDPLDESALRRLPEFIERGRHQ